jgi:hypothetical protein
MGRFMSTQGIRRTETASSSKTFDALLQQMGRIGEVFRVTILAINNA